MRRGFYDMIAEVLMETKVKLARKTRIAARAGVNNVFMQEILEAGLLKEGPHRFAVLTEKGNEFLQYFQALEKLCPRETNT